MASKHINLTIITYEQTETHSIEWIEIESPTGNFTAGVDHASIISAIESQGTIKYKKQNCIETSFTAKGGTFILDNNNATLLLD